MSEPSTTELEKHFINKAINENEIGTGKFIELFEGLWSNRNKYKFGVSCNSGTNALYLALKALNIGEGDEVIVPEYTMIATAWAVTYTGATPVFVDCADDLNIDVSKIKVTDKTKAIITVPIYGRHTERIETSIPIIEDMAEAHGIQPTGDIACYSFYGNKILATGEGGMCLTNDVKIADEIRNYANMYFDTGRSMIHPKIGHNFRLSNLQASIGVAQVMRIDEILIKRKNIEGMYNSLIPERFLMPNRDVLWMYDIKVTDEKEQTELKNFLLKKGIPTRYGFKPMSMQPMYNMPYKRLNAYKWSKKILYLPTWTDMSMNNIKKVCKAIQSFDGK